MSYPIIPIASLRTLAGEACFQQGQQAVSQRLVKKFQYENRMAHAQVLSFTPKVRYVGDKVEGSCNCPQSEGFEFCEHCVAVVLSANDLARQRQSLYKGPDKSKVMAYLMSLEKKELAQQCLELIDNDPALMKRYLLRISLGAEEIDFKKLRSQITELTRNEGSLFSQRQVQHFFVRIQRFLEELSSADYMAQPEAMSKVIEYAFKRVNLVLEQIRSRHSAHEPSAEILRHLYLHLIAVLPSKALSKTAQLLKVWLSDRFTLLGSINDFLKEDTELQECFYQKLLQLWIDQDKKALQDWQLNKIAAELLSNLSDSATLEQIQSWRIQLATSADDWLRITEAWLEHGQANAAQDILLKQLHLHPSHTALQTAILELYQEYPLDIEPVFHLFCLQPAALIDTLMEIADQQSRAKHQPKTGSQSIQQRCVEHLTKHPSEDNNDLLMKLLLDLDKSENTADGQLSPALQSAVNLAQNQTVNPELDFELVFRVLPVRPEPALKLFHRTLKQLLESQRRRQDEIAAEALFKFEQALPENFRLDHEDLLDQTRLLAQRRPVFLQHYRQITQSGTY